MAPAAPVVACRALGTLAASLEDLDRNAIAGLHAPTLGRSGAERFDDADGLVARHEGEAGREGAGVLLVVCTAEPARLDAQDAVVVADVGDGEVVRDEPPRLFQDESPRR
jgi:hypothetical protein